MSTDSCALIRGDSRLYSGRGIRDEASQHRCKYIPVICVGDVLSPTLL